MSRYAFSNTYGSSIRANSLSELLARLAKQLKSKRWGELMDKAYKSQFTDRLITMPCCGFKTDLNSLRYESPAGFARFVLETDSLDLDWLPVDRQSMLEEVLGCKLRQIWTMY